MQRESKVNEKEMHEARTIKKKKLIHAARINKLRESYKKHI